MNDIAISFIVPIYNVEKYLDRCIESLRNQTLKNIEIISEIEKNKILQGYIKGRLYCIENVSF